MIRRPPRSTRTDTLFPYTTLFRSESSPLAGEGYEALASALREPTRSWVRGRCWQEGARTFANAGRYELGGGGNFNPNWPDLAAAVAGRVAERLADDEAGNVAVIRRPMPDHLEADRTRAAQGKEG